MDRIAAAIDAGAPGIVVILGVAVVHAVGMGLTIYAARSAARRAGAEPPLEVARRGRRAAIAMVLAVHAIEIALAVGYFAWLHETYTATGAYDALVHASGDFPLLIHWQLVAAVVLALTALWSAVVLGSIARRVEDALGT